MKDAIELITYKPEANCLANKNIVVTGAGSGIGAQAAMSFAEFGATVILAGRTLEKLEWVYDKIEQAGYPKPAIYPINLEGAAEQDFIAMGDALKAEFKCIDGLLHNAAELGARTPIANYPLRDWQKLMQVNVTAPFLMTRSLLPLLQKSQAASILFTGSSVGVKGRAYWGAYAVSKAACENMMQVLADEFDGNDKIRVNSINPGATRTGMRAIAYPAEDPGTVTEAKDLMNRYIYLMCDESKSVNGQQFNAQPK